MRASSCSASPQCGIKAVQIDSQPKAPYHSFDLSSPLNDSDVWRLVCCGLCVGCVSRRAW